MQIAKGSKNKTGYKTDESTLTKYLLYGTVKEQQKYIVKDGDTIESIATANKLNTKLFCPDK